jgi:hypothetical protein
LHPVILEQNRNIARGKQRRLERHHTP